jgi:hypothetical protein
MDSSVRITDSSYADFNSSVKLTNSAGGTNQGLPNYDRGFIY